MKTRFLLVVGLLNLPLLPVMAQWGQPPATPLINVTGSAEVKVAPDEVDLSASVETRDESLDAAKQQNDERVAKALDFLRHNGVKDKEVQTDYVSIEPVYDTRNGTDPRTGLPLPGYDNHGLAMKPVYYLVRRGIGVRLTEVNHFDAVLSGLITNGVNYIQGIDFRTSELRKYKDQARAMAIRAAKEKADAMAVELGVKVGKPYTINVSDAGGWNSWSRGYAGSGFGDFGGGGGFGGRFQNAAQNAGGTGENGPTLAVGQISVSASVTVSFLIQ